MRTIYHLTGLTESFFTFSQSQNPFGLKLPQLLSQYLYLTKKLDLPGIGSFVLDPNVVIPEQSDKNLHTHATGISFKNTSIFTPDDGLIEFIKEHTGKMKPLAAADLDFFLTTGKQLLNIGKPFYLDGIGTLIKNKDGRLDFTPGEYSTARLEDGPERKERVDKKTAYDEPRHEYEPRTNNFRQILLLIGIIAGLVAIGWGGYYLYKKNTFVEPPVATNTEKPATDSPAAATVDSTSRIAAQPAAPNPATATAKRPDTLSPSPSQNIPVPGPDQVLYKFIILETTRKARALRRYNQLIGFQLNIKMDQKDSSYFKLYFPIAAAIRDTAYIKDSLTQIYAAHVTIEH
jgi:hypothetical protein